MLPSREPYLNKFNSISYFVYVYVWSAAGMIQISNTTNMLLDMQGGFKTEERGGVEVKASSFSLGSIHKQCLL